MKHHHQITYWGDDPGIRVLKVHGSCNFLPDTNLQGTTYLHITYPGRSYGPIKPCGNLGEIEQLITAHNVRRGIPAAMKLYTESKDVIGGENELGGVLTEFQECIRVARLVIVVGVKPNPDDKHIWGHLASMTGKLLIVGGEEDCEEWVAKYRPGDSNVWLSSAFAESLPLIFEKIDQVIP